MATTNRLQITELDFDTIKNNLKNFLRSQTEFQDYDFEGSGLSILLDVLAYNTHYNSYYLNMVANEAFLDTSILRDSVVSHAKTLGYTPYSTRASKATINITVPTDNTTIESFTIPRRTTFKSNLVDLSSYNFVLLEDVTVTKTGTDFIFENVEIYQGDLVDYVYDYVQQTNPKAIFTLPDSNIDVSTLKVIVQESQSNSSIETYNLITDVLEVDATTPCFFLQEYRNGQYQIYFGDGVIGKKLKDGCVVQVQYLVTNGPDANGVDGFVLTENVPPYDNFFIDIVQKSIGGAYRESIDEIKYLAPIQYTSQNRLVTVNDYISYIKRKYPVVDSISVWGGEEETPPVFGKIFISLKPVSDYYITETEKQNIIKDIVSPKAIVTVKTEIRDPEYLYILTTNNVKYKKEKTNLTKQTLTNDIRDSIISFRDLYLDKFNSTFVSSKLQEIISLTESNAIIGSECVIRVQKRILPVFNTKNNYEVAYNVPLLQGTGTNKLTSTEFDVYDINGIRRTVTIEEVPKSYTGIHSVNIVDPGTGYTSTPTVTITGDGFGATAVAIMNFGRVQSIQITNPGVDYTKAIITISGGGGFGATAVAVLDSKIGTLRTVYYNQNSERQIVNGNAGTIDYSSGIILITDINILSTNSADNLIRFNIGVQSNILQSTKNTILTIDENDPSSIVINLESI